MAKNQNQNQNRTELIVGFILLIVAILLPVAVGIAYYALSGHAFVGAFFGFGTLVMVASTLRYCSK